MKTRVLIFLFLFCCLSLAAQIRLEGCRQADINPERLEAVRVSEGVKVPVGFLKTKTSLTVLANSKVHTARLVLLAGTDGVFVWKGKEYQLKSGEQVLTVE